MADRPMHILFVSALPQRAERINRLATELPAGSLVIRSILPAELPVPGESIPDAILLDAALATPDHEPELTRLRGLGRGRTARLVLHFGEAAPHLRPFHPHEVIASDELTARLLELKVRLAVAELRTRRRQTWKQRKLRTIHRIARISLEAESLDAAFRELVDELGEATRFPMIGLAQFEEAGGRLLFRASRGLGLPPDSSLAVATTESLSGLAASTGKPIVEVDASAHGERLHPALRAAGARALVAVPIKLRGRVLGVLTLAHRRSFPASPSFLRWLEGVADAIALLVDRLGARDAMRRNEARYRALIENAADTITIVAPDGVVQYQSPGAQRMLGYRPEQLEGHNLFELVHPDDVDAARAGLARIARLRPRTFRWSGRLRHADGSWRTVEAALRNLVDDPAVGGVVINAHDVTGARALEEQLHHSQKLDAVGRLAGGVAHDFNNLLTAVTGHARLLLDDLPRTNPMRGDLEEILDAAERGAALTRQLLSFSRKQVLEPKVLELSAVVRDVERLLRRLIPEDIELVTRLGDQPTSIRADRSQLDQVIVNLAVNARDAMPGGGRMAIETRTVHLDEEYASAREGVRAGRHAVLIVSDTGHGMDEATRRRIFEPFFTTKEKGTGLGLSTVYGIVRQNGGHIWVYSEPGRGTTFKLYFPVVGGVTTTAPAPSGASPPGVETILVVDDETPIRRLIAKTLGRLGYTVLEAADADEALRVARHQEGLIHLLLTDLMLPGKSGKELAGEMRTLQPRLPIIISSGYSQADIGDDLPHDALMLEKPFTPAALARVVREALDARGQLPTS